MYVCTDTACHGESTYHIVVIVCQSRLLIQTENHSDVSPAECTCATTQLHLLSARLSETLMPSRDQRNASISASYQTAVVVRGWCRLQMLL